MTTPENRQSHLKGLPLEGLSAVAQDAVVVCRELSIRYLWIDALCILQGESTEAKEDWQTESGMMDSVFSRAYVTICASNAHGSHHSFLSRPAVPRLRISFATGPSPPSNLSLCPQRRLPDYFILTPAGTFLGGSRRGSFAWDYANSRWNRRGWVHQEQELSQRLLVFGKHLIHFSSGGYHACENGWEPDPRLFEHRSASRYIYQEHPGAVTTPPTPGASLSDLETRRRWFEKFRESVLTYSRKKLTFRNDRLPGLAGLARKIHNLTGSRYHAGLWEDTLHIDLLFVISHRHEVPILEPAQGTDYVAPSWSWASNSPPDSFAYYYLPDIMAKSEMSWCQASVVLKGRNIFGEVESGQLTLRTHILASRNVLESGSTVVDHVSFRIHGPHLADVYLDATQEDLVVWDLSNFDRKHVALALISSDECGNGADKTGYGLVLSMSEKMKKYFRIGVFASRNDKGGGLGCCKDWPFEVIEIV